MAQRHPRQERIGAPVFRPASRPQAAKLPSLRSPIAGTPYEDGETPLGFVSAVPIARLRRAAASSDSSLLSCERGESPLSHFPPNPLGSEQSSLPLVLARVTVRRLEKVARRAGNADLRPAPPRTAGRNRALPIANKRGDGWNVTSGRHPRPAPTAAGGLRETPEGSCRRATWPGPLRSSPAHAAGP